MADACRSRRIERARRRFLMQWVTLLDTVNDLEGEYRRLPEGAFTPDEEWGINDALQDMWERLTNHRPSVLPDGTVETDAPNPVTVAAIEQRRRPHHQRPAAQRILEVVRDLRSVDSGGRINAQRIWAELERRRPDDVCALSTMRHALAALCLAGLIERDEVLGWTPKDGAQ